MDLAVLSGLLVTPRLPLEDPWFAGRAVPVLPLRHVPSSRSRSASPRSRRSTPTTSIVALVAALAGAAAFGVVRLRGGGRGPALAAALLLAFAGTLDGARQLLAGTPLAARRPLALLAARRGRDHRVAPLHALARGPPPARGGPAAPPRLRGDRGPLRHAGPASSSTRRSSRPLVSANPWDLPAALLLARRRDARDAGAEAGAPARRLDARACRSRSSSRRSSRRGPSSTASAGVTARTTSPEAFLHLGGAPPRPGARRRESRSCARATTRRSRSSRRTSSRRSGSSSPIVTKRPVLGLGAAFLLAVLQLLPRLTGALRVGVPPRGGGRRRSSSSRSSIVVRDPYGEELHRMNTVFKCYAAARGPARPRRRAPRAARPRDAAGAVGRPRGALVVAVAGAPRPPGEPRRPAVGAPQDGARRPRLDDRPRRRATSAAVEWIRRNCAPGARIVEAVGGAYTDHGRIGERDRPADRPRLDEPPGALARRGGDGRDRARGAGTSRRSTGPATRRRSARRSPGRGAWYVVVGPLERKEYGRERVPRPRRAPARLRGARDRGVGGRAVSGDGPAWERRERWAWGGLLLLALVLRALGPRLAGVPPRRVDPRLVHLRARRRTATTSTTRSTTARCSTTWSPRPSGSSATRTSPRASPRRSEASASWRWRCSCARGSGAARRSRRASSSPSRRTSSTSPASAARTSGASSGRSGSSSGSTAGGGRGASPTSASPRSGGPSRSRRRRTSTSSAR